MRRSGDRGDDRPDHRGDDRGVAAVELAMFTGVFLLLVSTMLPLGLVISARNGLGRAAGDTSRFAVQVPDRARPGVDPANGSSATGYGRRPTGAEILADLCRRLDSSGPVAGACGNGATVEVGLRPPDPTDPADPCLPVDGRTVENRRVGDCVTVTARRVIDLGPFAGILAGAGLISGTYTVSATSLAIQE